MKEMLIHGHGWISSAQSYFYILDINFQFIFNWMPIVYRTCNVILNWINRVTN